MKKVIFLLLLFITCSHCIINAQDVKTLSKQNKDLMSKIKRDNQLKEVSIQLESDGYWYFLLKSKSKYLGVADRLGKVLIDTKYESITYVPAQKEETKTETVVSPDWLFAVTNERTYEEKKYHEKSPATFLCKSMFHDQAIYDINGQLLKDNIIGTITPIFGYYSLYQRNDSTVDHGNALMTHTGEILIDYSEKNDFIIDDKVCYFKKTRNNITYEGAIMLDRSESSVPALFNSVRHNKHGKGWEVKLTENSELEEYNPNKNYAQRFRDKGEEYYESRQYDKVIDFYSHEGISAPWSKFFTAMSTYNQYDKIRSHATIICNTIEGNDHTIIGGEPFIDRCLREFDDVNFDLAPKDLSTVIALMDAYLQQDKIYEQEATITIGACKDIIKNDEIGKLQIRYNAALKKLQAQKNAEQARLIQIQQQRSREQAQLIMGILSGFMKALVNTGSNNNSTGYSGSSAGSVAPSSSSSSSSSNNAGKIAEWENRKSNAQNQLAKYQADLIREPNSASIKSNIRAQEDIIRTCDESIS